MKKLKRTLTAKEREEAEKRLRILESVHRQLNARANTEVFWMKREILKLRKWLRTGERFKISSDELGKMTIVFIISGSLGVAILFLITWIFG